MRNKGFIKRRLEKLYSSKIFNPVRKIITYLRKKIEKNIRFELMTVFAICFAISFIFYAFASDFLQKEETYGNINYDYVSIENTAKNYVDKIVYLPQNSGLTLESSNEFFNMFGDLSNNEKAYITDLDGEIIYKSNNVVEDKVDIFQILSNTMSVEYYKEEGEEKSFIYPLTIGEDKCYFIYSATPSAEIVYETNIRSNNFLALILSGIVFILIFIIVTNNKMKYLDEIALGLRKIASGDLDYRIKEIGKDEIKNLASNINYMAEEIEKKIEIERNAEKTKSDLITNVSHDLRTPLTSIMGYIGLIKSGKYDSEDTMNEYLDIAFKKSEKLKILIDDLFEYTKLNNEGIRLKKIDVNLNEFILQLIEEFIPIFEENEMEVIEKYSEEPIKISLDVDKMVRVFENLLTNAIKYSYKPGYIKIEVYKESEYAIVCIKNRGENIPKEKLERLFDRFYRVDESRNTEMGGSGLGLAISKNIVELHNGLIWAECNDEEISFFVKLKF